MTSERFALVVLPGTFPADETEVLKKTDISEKFPNRFLVIDGGNAVDKRLVIPVEFRDSLQFVEVSVIIVENNVVVKDVLEF
jgi:hypothetical protein